MVTRRDVVLGAMAVSALPAIAGAWVSPKPGSTLEGGSALYKVIYDERFPLSVAFGHEALRAGLAVHAIRGDMTDLWYDDLYPQWRRQPLAIAGLTAHGPLFCLERLSWDFGMRVATRDARPGELISWVIAPGTRA
ncbi:MAG TPA: hypothetical protein VE046_02345 [Steroidobacteraceae bacterium]|nr:hypothetical protein [Steroidobacteraceae bacterium]